MTENKEDKKMYYCEEKQAICITDSCAMGKELLHGPVGSRGEHEDPFYTGCGKRFLPGELTTYARFKDGTEKVIVGPVDLLKGCENKSKYSKEFLDTLKQLCLEFDSKAESYPNPDYVGFALYFYATHPDYKLTPGYGGSIDIQADFCEGGEEWIEKLDKEIESIEVKTLKLPNDHFVFRLDEGKIDEILRLAFSHITVKKDELFQDESPTWLADSFSIAEIKYEHGIVGTVEIYPYDELYVVDETTMSVLENKNKHEVIGMTIRS